MATIALTGDQYREIIETIQEGGQGFRANPRIAAALMLEANLGLRIGDILQLRLVDIIRDGGRYRLNVTEEKTGKKRAFTVPAEIYSWLRDYCDANGIGRDEIIFPLTVRQIQKHLKTVCEYLELENVSTHSFRKYFATDIYRANGNDLVLVSKLLQHSSPSITRRYIGISEESMEKAIAGHVNII